MDLFFLEWNSGNDEELLSLGSCTNSIHVIMLRHIALMFVADVLATRIMPRLPSEICCTLLEYRHPVEGPPLHPGESHTPDLPTHPEYRGPDQGLLFVVAR